jgi:hypothetical protein
MHPFQPPKADLEVGAGEVPPIQGGAIPGTVTAAVVILGVLALSEVWRLAITTVMGLVVAGLLVVGLLRGHPLAWQWGIGVPAFMILLRLVAAVPKLERLLANPIRASLEAATLALYAAIPILLYSRSARVFFGLRCPRCGAVKGRAASFLYAKRRCGACQFIWTPVRA